MLQNARSLRVGFTFAGCYLGAGYVSGQELWQFFGCFGRRGIGGLVLAVSLSFFFGVLLLRLVQRTGLHQTDTLVVRRPIPLLRGAVGMLQLVILFGLFVIMTAGVGALLRQLFGLNSTRFSLRYADGVFRFDVRGYGHRVGMSQYGANAIARLGFDYQTILRYYYRGAKIETQKCSLV